MVSVALPHKSAAEVSLHHYIYSSILHGHKCNQPLTLNKLDLSFYLIYCTVFEYLPASGVSSRNIPLEAKGGLIFFFKLQADYYSLADLTIR